MKILAFSDIHTDVNSQIDPNFVDKFTEFISNLRDIDIVVCAGDVSPRLEDIKDIFDIVTSNLDANHYFFVPGNHDVWEIDEKVEDGISRVKYEEKIPDIVSQTKFHYLPRDPYIIDDQLAFFGNIGWYDYTLRNRKWDDYLKKERQTWYYAKTLDGGVWNDAVYAEWGMHDLDVVQYCLERLEKDYNKISDITSKIAVLHHIPFQQGVLHKNDISWDYYSGFMGSENFGDKLVEWNIDSVIYGHTHGYHQYQERNVNAYCFPIGYISEWETQDFKVEFEKRTKIIELKEE